MSVIAEMDELLEVSWDGGEARELSQLKLSVSRAKSAASELYGVTSGAAQRKVIEGVYAQLKKLDVQVQRLKATRTKR